MPWTQSQQLRHLLALPWTIVPGTTAEGDRTLRVAQLPSAFAAVGPECSQAELEVEFWDAVTDVLRSYLHYGDPIPLPSSVASLPWEVASPRGTAQYVAPLSGGMAQVIPPPTAVFGNVNQNGLVAT